MNIIKGLTFIFSLFILSDCYSQIAHEVIKDDCIWIKNDIKWETDSSDFRYSGIIYNYGKGVLVFFGQDKHAKIIYATLFKNSKNDTLSFELTEGGAILNGSWKIISNNTILIKSKLITENVVYPIDDKQKTMEETKIDTLDIMNNNKIVLNDNVILTPLKFSLSKNSRRLLLKK